ncbi:calcium channel protein [Tulasnella sp. 419]|nr:calcium channel protein [Tulasnella sp. 419]
MDAVDGETPTTGRTSSRTHSPVLEHPGGGLQRRFSWSRNDGDADSPQRPVILTTPEHAAAPLRHSVTPYEAPFKDAEQPRPYFHHDFPTQSQGSLESGADDDEVHLTGAVRWQSDTEGNQDRPVRTQNRYKDVNSPLARVPTLKSVSRNLRRVSVRVVNLAGITLEDRPIRLEDDHMDETPKALETPTGENPSFLPNHASALPGRTLGVFGPHSTFRRTMYNVLTWTWTEPIILLLIFANAIVLTIQSARSVFANPRPSRYFQSPEDYILFVLFVIFTLEAFARTIVSGFIFYPETRITDIKSISAGLKTTKSRVQSKFSSTRDPVEKPSSHSASSSQPQYGGTHMQQSSDQSSSSSWIGSRIGLPRHPFQLAIERQQSMSKQSRPYLRHSWNRIDFVAVLSYWIMFALSITGLEARDNRHLYIFRALSVLRVARLLAVTSGTTTIMRSLKTAGPLLVNVAAFVLFAVILFSIIGVQAFKGSFRRTCQLMPSDSSGEPIDLGQNCGGYIDPITLAPTGAIDQSGETIASPKGFICPLGQQCIEAASNPHSNVQSFDNIFFGALQVFIVAGVNQWAPVMYTMMDADFFVSCLFFIVGVIVLNFWLLNMFVAVITNTFASIRAETKKSAFGAGTGGPVIDERDEGWFYRVILTVPRMRPLLLRVFGNMYGLANMTLFLLLTNFLAALIAVQLFRGDVSQENTMNFSATYNSFLAMYQIFTSENWTDILYLVAESGSPFHQTLISVLFVVAWFFFANFILLQMFIAVINENFEVAEEHKRNQQFNDYLRKSEPTATRVNWVDKWNPYRFIKANPKSLAVESMPSNLVLPLKKAVVVGDAAGSSGKGKEDGMGTNLLGDAPKAKGFIGVIRRWFDLDRTPESVQMATLKSIRRESVIPQTVGDIHDNERHLDILAVNTDATIEETNDALYEQRAQKGDFIEAHPSYDKTFWLLSNQNKLRFLCQKVVTPANGERIFGTSPSNIAQPLFQLVIILAVFGGIGVAWKATPIYRREYYAKHGFSRGTWFDIADLTFGGILLIEFLVKITADGFIFTPNAYLLSIWNVIDFLILCALLANMITTLVVIGGVSRVTRSLKAFRALRLITFFPWMRETFHSVLFAGARSLFDAALLALLYMVPYAVWGVNIFSGLMYMCNDENSPGKAECINEYIATPIEGSDMGFLAPRAWDRPSPSTVFSFDSFGRSLLILFEIVSLEGWIDIMGVAMGIQGRDLQPKGNTSELNSIFFVAYNLLGAVVILTLFVSIIIGNFSTRSGMALLTEEQKRWIDLQKLIKRQRPSKRPKVKPSDPWRAWCFDRAVSKHGWWSRCMTGLYCVHIAALMTQTFTEQSGLDTFRDILFLFLTTLYLVDVIIRMIGLGWRSFRANGWNLFDVFVITGSFATTVPIVLGTSGFLILQSQKLFLVSIAFKLVQKNNGLNQLFKTSVASLPAIMKLLLLWITLFLFFSIAFVEVFGLTRWGSAENHNQNYNSITNALVMLVFMSVGEGWNQYMHDYARTYPMCTNSSLADVDSDCGSTGWAFFLFISWNLLSMYIFLNMFTGVVVENFSYVFQLHGSQNSLNRDEMRAFKKTWAAFDVNGAGYLEKSQFVKFFSRLSGVFEVRIYPAQFELHNIIKAAQASDGPRTMYSAPVVDNIDIRKLAGVLDGVDQREVRRRRLLYNRLYHEAMVIAEPGKGISFTNMLLLLCHYKIIVDDSALRLDEMLRRRTTIDYVTDTVNLDRVRSLLKMIYFRRRYLAWREERARARWQENQGIPEIVVDDTPSTPTLRSRDITQANRDSQGFQLEDNHSYSSSGRTVRSPENPFNPSEPSSPIVGARPRYSDASMFSGIDLRPHSARESMIVEETSPQEVLTSLDKSIWGEMMHDLAIEEEDD